jgi:hypothetical protein
MVDYYKELNITGGEPMLFPQELLAFLHKFYAAADSAFKHTVYLYTAECRDLEMFMRVLNHVDGITLTLHNQGDVAPFEHLNNMLNKRGPYHKSLRLSVFGDITLPDKPYPLWNIQMGRVYLDECALPEDDLKVMRWNYERRPV